MQTYLVKNNKNKNIKEYTVSNVRELIEEYIFDNIGNRSDCVELKVKNAHTLKEFPVSIMTSPREIIQVDATIDSTNVNFVINQEPGTPEPTVIEKLNPDGILDYRAKKSVRSR